MLGVSLLAGIGFTVSLLIGELAFGYGSVTGADAKIGVLCGSVVAGAAGRGRPGQPQRRLPAHSRSRDRRRDPTVCPTSTSARRRLIADAVRKLSGCLNRSAVPLICSTCRRHSWTRLAREIRDFLIHKVAATGGHLGPNLGVVELTLALHRVFDSPHDPIIFDTGHQAYVHKMLTGRCQDFDTLRKKDGLSGYPSREESEHDWVESSHASASLSYADGLAKAFELSGHRNRHVVAVVGDGALTGGMCWEALNNIAASKRPIVIVVNDNGRSYAPTIGGFADHLAGLRLQPGYERVLEEGRKAVRGLPVIGEFCYQCMHSVKAGIKDALSPQVMFTDLGLKYVGPIDGHDEHAVESALRHARAFNAPVVVHVVTRKGMGYAPAENDEDDQMHACGVIDPQTGLATTVPGARLDLDVRRVR